MNIFDPDSGNTLVAEAASPFVTNHTESSLFPLNILVVDDDPGVRNILACILRRVGYEVMCAVDGEEGWEALCAGNYDGMITDHQMPRLSGLDLIRRVRAVPSDLPVIMVSGQMPHEELDFLELLPPGTALPKPFALGEVMSVVSRVFVKGSSTRPVLRRQNNARFQAPSASGIHFSEPL